MPNNGTCVRKQVKNGGFGAEHVSASSWQSTTITK
ncbi:MAG: hypothetical protein K0R67_2904, partial [Paenibacillus sp.]|nr:hypothetical protein [Paenibacillus sp.]